MEAQVIRLSRSAVGVEEQQAVARVIAAGYLGMGGATAEFEKQLRDYLGGASEAICVSSGTAALQLALQAAGIGAGDEVIVPSLTFVASFQAVSATGARPVACDVNLNSGFMDTRDAERRLTSRTRAVMPVHYASAAPELEEVYQFANTHELRVVEDAAHAFGTTRNGMRVGSQGDLVCFSFDGIKNITCGEGGAIVTRDAQAAQKLRDARLLGVEQDTEKRYRGERSWDFDVHAQGWRYHMSNIMAAIGSVQLGKLAGFAEHRRKLVITYLEALEQLGGMLPLRLPYSEIVPHIFAVRVLDARRDALFAYLRSNAIECGIHYKPNHLLSKFKTTYRLPNSERLGAELISLPLHACLTAEEQSKVIGALRTFFVGS